MKKEHRMKKRAYLDDYHKNSEGKYEYRGKVFTCEGGNKRLTQIKQRMWAVYAIVIICVVAGGCIPTPGFSGCVYVILPYALGLMGAISLGWALLRLTTAGEALKEYIYNVTVKKIPHRALLSLILNGVAFAGVVIYVVLNGYGENIFWFLLFCLLEAAACAGSAAIYKIAESLQWKQLTEEVKKVSKDA